MVSVHQVAFTIRLYMYICMGVGVFSLEHSTCKPYRDLRLPTSNLIHHWSRDVILDNVLVI